MLYWISRFIFEVLIRILFRVNITGAGNFPEPPFIIVSNHSSLLDPPLVGAAYKKHPINFMAKQELFDAPVLGAWTRRVRCIKVRRGGNSVSSLKEALKRLSDGQVVGVFPEGTRSVDGDLQKAKRGTGFLIAKAGVPVVPVYVDGATTAFPKGQGIAPGARINIFVGKKILPEEFLSGPDLEKKDYEAVSNMVMDRIFRMRKAANGAV